MAKSADAFRTISEVAEWLETPAHVLRFWESKFSQVKPVKRAGGRRYYRPADMKLLGGIKKLLHEDGMTIKGVQKLLREQGVAHVADLSQPLGDAADDVVIDGMAVSDVTEPKAPVGTAALSPEQADAPKDEATEGEPTPEPEEARETPLTFTRHTAPSEPVKVDAKKDDAKPEIAQDDASEQVPELPSFQYLRGKDTDAQQPAMPTADKAEGTSAPVGDEAPDTEPEPAAPRPVQVDVPDDPDDMIDAEPGVLARLATLPRPISIETAERLKPILDKLRDRASG